MNLKIYIATSKGRRKTQFGGPENEGRKVKILWRNMDPKHTCLKKRNPQNLYAFQVEEEEEDSESEESSEDDMRN